MKIFLVHLKSGGTPLKYEAIGYETIEGKIYFFKDEEKKDRSLFVDEGTVNAITEKSSKIPFKIEFNWKHPLILAGVTFFVLEVIARMILDLRLSLAANLIPLAVAGMVYLFISKPNLKELSIREEWKKIGFRHPIVWGVIGFLLLEIFTSIPAEFLVIIGIVKSLQWVLILAVNIILLIRLIRNKERPKTIWWKIHLASAVLIFILIPVFMIPIYKNYLSYEARLAPLKNIGYWEKVLTTTPDGYVAFVPNDYEMAGKYGEEKGPCVYQFKGGSFFTEPSELTASEKLDGYVWKAKGIFKCDGMRKLNLQENRWLDWREYNQIDYLCSVDILRDKIGKWMIIYPQELKEMTINLSKLPRMD